MVSFIDIIFLMIVIAVVFSRLYSSFGTRGNEKNVRVIIERLDENSENKLAENIAHIIKEAEKDNKNPTVTDLDSLSETDKALAKIEDFDKASFLRSACRVFEMILQAFSAGNLEGIRGLVSKKIWDAFQQAINLRRQNNLTSEVDFIGFKKTEIKNVKLLKNSVKITVEFESDQINILKNAAGEVLEGDENYVQHITDIWTFERTLNAKNPNWLLVSTKKSA